MINDNKIMKKIDYIKKNIETVFRLEELTIKI